MKKPDKLSIFHDETGVTLIETLVAVAILGIIAVIFLGSLTSTSKGAAMADERVSAQSIAQTQMEYIKNAAYTTNATTYTPYQLPTSKDYTGYSVNITAVRLHATDDGIQKITVSVLYGEKVIMSLEDYKVDR